LQLHVPGAAVLDELDQLGGRGELGRIGPLELAPGAAEQLALDRHALLQVRDGGVEHRGDIAPPIDLPQIAPRGAQRALDLLAELKRAKARLARRRHGPIEQPPRHLRAQDRLGGRLGILDVVIERAVEEVDGLVCGA